ncbi:MAG: UDP-N-acetylmuramate--L-alanine ligase, partial [Lewinella sp.]|nr:UDP-N-acetylmuramate--L-alanine ligase [Lewinella sp.]
FMIREPEVVYVDDYAHHPAELKAAIDAARTLYPDRKITGIFQPHLYSRTRDFVDGFAEALDQLDEIFLMDIYPAREAPIPGVSSDLIYERMKNPNCYRVNKANLLPRLERTDLQVVLSLGAGDIDTFVNPIRELLAAKIINHG